MPELIVDILAGIFVIALSLVWYFYAYPLLKQEYKENGWTWNRIYDIEVNNRRSYKELARIIWTAIRKK